MTKPTFDEFLRKIMKDENLHKRVRQSKKELEVVTNYDSWNRGAKYYRKILIDPKCGVVFYNRQLGSYAEGDETDDCVSRIIYGKKISFKNTHELVNGVPKLKKYCKTNKIHPGEMFWEGSFEDAFGGFCFTDSFRDDYFQGLDDEKDWGKGRYIVGKGIPKEDIKRITGIKEFTLMSGWTNWSTHSGKPLLDLFADCRVNVELLGLLKDD